MSELREKVADLVDYSGLLEPGRTRREQVEALADKILAIPEIAEALRLQPVRYLRSGDEEQA